MFRQWLNTGAWSHQGLATTFISITRRVRTMNIKSATGQHTHGANGSQAIARVAEQVSSIGRRGMTALGDTSQRLQAKALDASDHTVRYIQTEPYKATLIAAAAGAALVALVSLAGRSRLH
jgi:ElaB/YqjD/DUF883 family membrane-anchored ribosome-binding protein